MFFAQPYDDPKGVFVDQVHSHDLVTSLSIILLIDTQSVRPDQSRSLSVPQSLECVGQIGTNANVDSIAANGNIFVF
jgi:hypothetical protein